MMSLFRYKIRPIILTAIAPMAGFTVIYLLEIFLKIELSKQLSSIFNLMVVALIAFLLFPKMLGVPFGRVETRVFLKKVGFYPPKNAWKHVILGLILAGCTLSGMLIASILTGTYVVDLSTINIPHLLFSLNPALWEELFFRGILMIWLLKIDQPLKRAFLIQLVLFGVMHIKGTDLLALIDAFTVIIIAVGFTYVAYKTRSLLAGIVFHYFHDAFLFLVLVPNRVYSGITENAVFYGSLWLMVGFGCIIAKYFSEKLDVRASEELYNFLERKNDFQI